MGRDRMCRLTERERPRDADGDKVFHEGRSKPVGCFSTGMYKNRSTRGRGEQVQEMLEVRGTQLNTTLTYTTKHHVLYRIYIRSKVAGKEMQLLILSAAKFRT